jgi:hypothetical protein
MIIMGKNSIAFLIFILICLSGCGYVNNPPAKRIELNGINGPAHYYYSRNNGKLISVIKHEYTSRPLEYSLSINKDTLQVGEEFIASMAVFNPSYQIIITQPENKIITGSYDYKKPEVNGFRYTADKEGMYILKGQLAYDSTIFPFEYKFIVLPKD